MGRLDDGILKNNQEKIFKVLESDYNKGILKNADLLFIK